MKLLLVATWKAWTVPILIAFGIAGMLFRGLLDMAQNFETGYGPESKKANIQAFSILGVFILAAILIALFGCSTAFGDPCGKERWDAKTHAYGWLTAEDSTVERLRAVATLPRAALAKVQGRLPAELKLYTVDALLIGFKKEADSDFHLVIASPKDKSLTMIAEAISPDCTDDGKLAEESATVRKYIEDNFGHATAKFKRLNPPVEVLVTGMFFLDFIHGQTGMAKNGCELHPLTAIQKIDQVTAVKPKASPTATPISGRGR